MDIRPHHMEHHIDIHGYPFKRTICVTMYIRSHQMDHCIDIHVVFYIGNLVFQSDNHIRSDILPDLQPGYQAGFQLCHPALHPVSAADPS